MRSGEWSVALYHGDRRVQVSNTVTIDVVGDTRQRQLFVGGNVGGLLWPARAADHAAAPKAEKAKVAFARLPVGSASPVWLTDLLKKPVTYDDKIVGVTASVGNAALSVALGAGVPKRNARLQSIATLTFNVSVRNVIAILICRLQGFALAGVTEATGRVCVVFTLTSGGESLWLCCDDVDLCCDCV